MKIIKQELQFEELAYSFHLGSDKDNEYRLKMIDVYNKQVKDLVKILPTFKVANATIHFDESAPRAYNQVA